MKWKCPICGKEYENFGIKDFSQCPKTTLFGKFTKLIPDGEPYTVDRKVNAVTPSIMKGLSGAIRGETGIFRDIT